MALPIVETPRYELTLPSSDVKVQYRPFLVKEEKILYMALESGDEQQMQSATKDILKSVTYNKIDVETLPTFDVEYIFLQVRAKSVGEVAKFKIICPDDKETYGDVEVDLSKVEVHVDETHTNKIIIDEARNLGVVFTYPTVDTVSVGEDLKADSKTLFKVLTNCIDHIFEGDKIYPAKDSTQKELKDFIESVTQKAFLDIKKFFESSPQLRHEVEVTNPKTGVKSKVTFKGLQDFFQ